MELDHIGLIADNLQNQIELFKKLGFTEIGNGKSHGCKCVFLKNNQGIEIELLEIINNPSIQKFKENNKSMFHHIAFKTKNTDEFLKERNLKPVNYKKKGAKDDMIVTFVLDKKNKLLIELCEYAGGGYGKD